MTKVFLTGASGFIAKHQTVSIPVMGDSNCCARFFDQIRDGIRMSLNQL